MNLKQANEIRASIGLMPITANDDGKRKRQARQAANRAARAQECREIRARRNSGKK